MNYFEMTITTPVTQYMLLAWLNTIVMIYDTGGWTNRNLWYTTHNHGWLCSIIAYVTWYNQVIRLISSMFSKVIWTGLRSIGYNAYALTYSTSHRLKNGTRYRSRRDLLERFLDLIPGGLKLFLVTHRLIYSSNFFFLGFLSPLGSIQGRLCISCDPLRVTGLWLVQLGSLVQSIESIMSAILFCSFAQRYLALQDVTP